jgi:hypothetical protein
MPAYGSFGGMDDQIFSDGDVGFVGMNQRLSPNQLGSGEVVLSRNGRIDGYWQPRRGIQLRSGALSNSATPLALPFYVIDSAKSVTNVTVPVTGVARLTVTGHGFGVGTSGWAELSGLDTGVNGVRFLTYVDANTMDAAVSGLTSVTDTSGTLDGAPINNSAVSAVYGSCLFSDPSSSLVESVFLATNLEAKMVDLTTYVVTSVPYPSGLDISSDVEMIQAFDRVYLFRDGAQALEWVPAGKAIITASYVSSTGVVTVNVKNHGLTIGDTIVVSDVGFSPTPTVADPNGTHVVATTADADTFTFVIATGAGDETYTPNTGKFVSNGFTKVLGGPYTQPQTFAVSSSDVSVTNGLVTVDVTGNNTIKVGDFIIVYETTIDEFTSVVGKSFQVVSSSATEIEFFAPVGDFTSGGSDSLEIGGRFSVGGGFIHQPGLPWATYFQRRLWGPYWYEPNGTTASPTYTDRKIRDEIVASDILDGDTYDQIYSQFRVTAGIADYLVGMQPFYDDALMVLNRNSLHVVAGTQGSLEDTVVKELTREVGCLARKSVVGKGNAVFFLSDSGVYGVEFIEQYNLRGLEEPLSKNIQPFIDRINKELAGNSVGIFFNNRYWLAVPLDTSAGKGDATGNNSILIFNTLNKAWESIDTYNIPNFKIKNFIIGQAGERNLLYLVNDTGGLHEIDANDQPLDVYSTNTTGSSNNSGMTYELVSRGYMLGATNLERKKFSRLQVQMQSNDSSSDVEFYFSSEDPDTDKFKITTINDMIGTQLPANETGNFRMRLGNPRGLYGTLTISSLSVGSAPVGRPKVNSITIDGTITNRQTISQY